MNRKFIVFLPFVLLLVKCGGQSLPASGTGKDSVHKDSVKTMQVIADTLDFSTEYLLGQFDPATHPDFTLIQSKHTTKTGAYLRKDAYEAFTAMHDSAKKDGISLVIISATRNFSAQKGIWENKWNGGRLVEGRNLTEMKDTLERALFILRYSSMPGTSRHHWGTDIDINDLNDGYFLSGQGKKEYEWLVNNAWKFGFCQPYSPKGENRTTGYEEEKWHWTYLPVSSALIQQYQEKISPSMIKGFAGAGTAEGIDVIQNYVLGINPDCKQD